MSVLWSRSRAPLVSSRPPQHRPQDAGSHIRQHGEGAWSRWERPVLTACFGPAWASVLAAKLTPSSAHRASHSGAHEFKKGISSLASSVPGHATDAGRGPRGAAAHAALLITTQRAAQCVAARNRRQRRACRPRARLVSLGQISSWPPPHREGAPRPRLLDADLPPTHAHPDIIQNSRIPVLRGRPAALQRRPKAPERAPAPSQGRILEVQQLDDSFISVGASRAAPPRPALPRALPPSAALR